MQINWKNCARAFDIQAKKERIEEIEGIMEEQGFWDNLDKVSGNNQRIKTIKRQS